MTTEATTETPTQTPEQVQLQISDLLLTAQVIQLASQRGAFRAEEFSQIGKLYDRVTAFLQASGALQTPAAPGAETPQAQ